MMACEPIHYFTFIGIINIEKLNPNTALPLWWRLVDFGLAGYIMDPYESSAAEGLSSKRFRIIETIFDSAEYDFIDRIIER